MEISLDFSYSSSCFATAVSQLAHHVIGRAPLYKRFFSCAFFISHHSPSFIFCPQTVNLVACSVPNIKPAHSFVAHDHVFEGFVPCGADVNFARRIGWSVEEVPFLSA